jgi:crotonobetainyl-CoA:carnitine CoA-transferase CaiB-like acyl-CoA transferase
MGNAHPSLFPYEPLPTADGAIIVIAGNNGQFATLCDVLGVPELADDDRFRSNEDRTANRDELKPLLVDALSKGTTEEWFERFRDKGPAGRAGQHRPGGRRVRRVDRARPGRRGGRR